MLGGSSDSIRYSIFCRSSTGIRCGVRVLVVAVSMYSSTWFASCFIKCKQSLRFANIALRCNTIAMKYISKLPSIITIGSSYIFRNNYNTYLQFHIVYCRDVIQHKVQVTTDIVCSTSQLHMMLLV